MVWDEEVEEGREIQIVGAASRIEKMHCFGQSEEEEDEYVRLPPIP